ncbi:MAG: hypothetical protein V8R75_04445 [Oscillospiraceae bacterium]
MRHEEEQRAVYRHDAFGAGIAVLSLLLGDRVENAVGGMLMGVGSGLFAMGLANLLGLRRGRGKIQGR